MSDASMKRVPNEPPDQKAGTESSPDRRLVEIGLVGGGLVLLVALLFVLRDFLSPLLIATAGAIVLWPYRSNQTARALLLAGGFIVFLWLLVRLAGVLVPFALAYLLAYLLNPALDAVDKRWSVPRWTLAFLITVLTAGVIVLMFILLLPTLVGELEQLATDIFQAMGTLRDYLVESAVLERLERAGVVDRATLINNVTELVQDQTTALANSIPDAAQRIARSLSSLLQFITIAAITPVLFYYTLKDYGPITARLREMLPRIRGSREYLNVAERVVGSYLRGQLMISAIAFVIVSVVLSIFNVPFALLIGLLAGILNMVPNIGIVITQVIGVLLALVFGEPGVVKAFIVFVVLLGESLLEQSVLTPRIQGHQVGLHPVLIILSLFVFGTLLGIFGLLIAVPATALLVAAYASWRDELTLDLGTSSKPAIDRLLNWRKSRMRKPRHDDKPREPDHSAE